MVSLSIEEVTNFTVLVSVCNLSCTVVSPCWKGYFPAPWTTLCWPWYSRMTMCMHQLHASADRARFRFSSKTLLVPHIWYQKCLIFGNYLILILKLDEIFIKTYPFIIFVGTIPQCTVIEYFGDETPRVMRLMANPLYSQAFILSLPEIPEWWRRWRQMLVWDDGEL